MRDRASLALPSDDKRWRVVEATMRRNGYRPDALIETLHTVQESFGYLDDEALIFVSNALRVAPSQVYGVATFYHFFNLKPQGEHTCAVCLGTACYIKGTGKILEHLQNKYEVEPGATTEDNKLSVLTVRCVGACGLAPAIVVDGETHGNVAIPDLDELLEGLLETS